MTASPLEQIIEDERRRIELGWAHEEERAIELTEAEKWARDPIGWINAYVFIASKFNEAGQPAAIRTVKMTLFPDQEETIGDWIDLEHLADTGELVWRNMALDKSRQIGETWAFIALIVWALLFHTVRGLVMSLRDAEVQDQGWTIDSLFGRAKFIYEHLDKQMPGLGHFHFKPGGKDPATITNTSRSSSVVGECQRDDPGRGKTYDFVFVDEAAFIQHGERVYAALSEACKTGKALASTPFGDGNMHARIVDARPRGWRIRRHHWSTHPLYSVGLHVAGEDPRCAMCEGNRQGIPWNAENPQAHRYPGKLTSPWYDEAVLDKTDSQVAQELDIDRAGALTARVYPEFGDVHVLPELNLPPRFSGIEIAWDFGTDTTVAVICEDTPAEYAVHGCVELGSDHGTTATASLVAAAIRAFCADVLGLDPQFLTPNWTRRWHCIGDPAGGHAATPNSRPEFEEYRKVGFEIQAPPHRLTARAETNIRAVQRLLLGHPKRLLVSQATADNFIVHFRNNVWPTDAVGSRRIGSTTPYDDVHDHACFVAGTLIATADGETPIEQVQPGDLVLTRDGLRPVLASFCSGVRDVVSLDYEGGTLTGTPDHPVWVCGEGWRPMGALEYGVWLLKPIGREMLTSVRGVHGSGRMAPSRPGITSTMLTATRSTMISQTLPAFLRRIIFRATATSRPRAGAHISSERGLYSRLASGHGHARPKAARSLLKGVARASLSEYRETTSATSAGAPTKATEHSERASVRPTAESRHDGHPVSMMSSAPVSSAESPSRSTGTSERPRALDRVRVVALARRVGRLPVYNLTVAETPEYFANGVLVHNCRAFAYLVVTKFEPPDEREHQGHDPQEDRDELIVGGLSYGEVM